MKPDFTSHANARMRQRGLREADLTLLCSAATSVADDALLLTDADARREIAQRKREIEQLQRLRGCKVVLKGEVVVTVYPAGRGEQRRTLRRGRENQYHQ